MLRLSRLSGQWGVCTDASQLLRRKETGTWWNKLNVIVDGKLTVHKLLIVLLSMCFITLSQLGILGTFYFGVLANLNGGIGQAIWNISPLFSALIDLWLFKARPKLH